MDAGGTADGDQGGVQVILYLYYKLSTATSLLGPMPRYTIAHRALLAKLGKYLKLSKIIVFYVQHRKIIKFRLNAARVPLHPWHRIQL